MNEPFKLELDPFTIVSCIVIVAAFTWAWVYIARTDSSELPKKQKWINQLPSIISTLGVLGTFVGITKGLVRFDTSRLDESIPLLLDGLKTAFFTSLTGMAGSLVLNRIVSARFENESDISESEKAAKMIIKAMDENLPRILDRNNTKMVTHLTDNGTINSIRNDIEQMKDDIEEMKGILQEINSFGTNVTEEISSLRAVASTATASISAMDNNIEEISRDVASVKSDVESIDDSLGGD